MFGSAQFRRTLSYGSLSRSRVLGNGDWFIKPNGQIRCSCINKTTEYCCFYWVNHLLKSTPSDDQFLEIHKPLLEFLKTQQLQWFEAFALVDCSDFDQFETILLGELQNWLESVSYQVYFYIIVLISNLLLSVQGTTQG